jgi:hypothetical protein
MHRYRIVAQIYLIFSILNLVLATPIAVREIREALGNEMVIAEDVAAKTNKRYDSEAASDGSTPPPSSPATVAYSQYLPFSSVSSSPPGFLDSGESLLLGSPPRR